MMTWLWIYERNSAACVLAPALQRPFARSTWANQSQGLARTELITSNQIFRRNGLAWILVISFQGRIGKMLMESASSPSRFSLSITYTREAPFRTYSTRQVRVSHY